MSENPDSIIRRRPHLTKEQRLPNCYKEVEKIVKSVKSCQTNFKTALAKSRLRGSQFKKVYKLSLNVLKYYNYIQKLIDKLHLLKKEKFLRKEIAAVLIYELIFGNGTLPGESKAVTTVQAYQNDVMNIHQELQNCNTDLEEFNEIYLPRYARVHTLVTTVACVIKDLQNYGFKQIFYDVEIPEEKFLQLVKSLDKSNFLIDFHFKDILVFSQAENLIELDLYKNGHIFLQDKASYIPVHALNPEPGTTVLDACAAPGMKSAHIASKMKNKGILIACERDESRFKTLKETLEYGSVKISRTLCTDFKLIDPNDEAYSAVDYILLDPSCSGSGMVNRMDNITDTENSKTKERLLKLAGFQIILLKHALKFPSVKRVVYSTCSVHEEENEYVVHEVLNAFGSTFKLVPVLSEWFDRGSKNYEIGKMCLRTVTEKHLTNGFFVAMFERIEIHEHRRKNFSAKHSRNENINKFDISLAEERKDPQTLKYTKHKKTEKKCMTNIQFHSVKQDQQVLSATSALQKECENSGILKNIPEIYCAVDINSNVSKSENKTKHKKHQISDNACFNQKVANVIQDSFLEKSRESKVLEFSKLKNKDKGGTNKFKNNKSNQTENQKSTVSESLPNSFPFNSNEVVDKKPNHKEQVSKNDSEVIEIYEIFDESNLKHKKKKSKRKHSLEKNNYNCAQEIEHVNKVNSFENKPEKIKDSSEFTLPKSNCLESQCLKWDKNSYNAPFKEVKKHKKHKKHSRNSDFTSSELNNALVSVFSESESNLKNYSLVKPTENLSETSHFVSQNEEMTEKQYLVDNYSKCKKSKKHKKHDSKSNESDGLVFSPDRNPNYISSDAINKCTKQTVPLYPEEISVNSSNQHRHVKKKRKKYENDESHDSLNFQHSNKNEHKDTVHDLKKKLGLNDTHSIVTPAENDCMERKKRKKHKKHLADNMFY